MMCKLYDFDKETIFKRCGIQFWQDPIPFLAANSVTNRKTIFGSYSTVMFEIRYLEANSEN